MFGRQAMRLLKKVWEGPYAAWQLAQELYAMFQDDIPLTHNAPVTINTTGTQAPLTLRNNDPSVPLLNVQVGDTTYPAITIDGGELVFGGLSERSGNNRGDGEGNDEEEEEDATVWLGKVTGHVTGQTYTCDLYGEGSAEPPHQSNVNVIVSGPPTDYVVANDTWLTVVEIRDEDTTFEAAYQPRQVNVGKVLSGSGASYTVALYENGTNVASTRNVTAVVPQIDAGETVPVDSAVVVIQTAANRYEFQPPVWLA